MTADEEVELCPLALAAAIHREVAAIQSQKTTSAAPSLLIEYNPTVPPLLKQEEHRGLRRLDGGTGMTEPHPTGILSARYLRHSIAELAN